MSDMIARIQRDLQQDSYYNQNFSNDGERFIAPRGVLRLRNQVLKAGRLLVHACPPPV